MEKSISNKKISKSIVLVIIALFTFSILSVALCNTYANAESDRFYDVISDGLGSTTSVSKTNSNLTLNSENNIANLVNIDDFLIAGNKIKISESDLFDDSLLDAVRNYSADWYIFDKNLSATEIQTKLYDFDYGIASGTFMSCSEKNNKIKNNIEFNLNDIALENRLNNGDYYFYVKCCRTYPNDYGGSNSYCQISNGLKFNFENKPIIGKEDKGIQNLIVDGEKISGQCYEFKTNNINNVVLRVTTSNNVYISYYEFEKVINTIFFIVDEGKGYGYVCKKSEDEEGCYRIYQVGDMDIKDIEIFGEPYLKIVELPEEPTKIGYKFVGWYYDEALTEPYIDGDILTEDIKLYAKFEPKKIDVTFYVNDEIERVVKVPYGDKATNLDLTQEGYTFSEWVDENNIPYDFNQIITKDINLFCTKTIITLKITFIVDGETYEVLNVPYGSTFSNNNEMAKAMAIFNEDCLASAGIDYNTQLTTDTTFNVEFKNDLDGWIRFGNWWCENWGWVVGVLCGVIVFLVIGIIAWKHYGTSKK